MQKKIRRSAVVGGAVVALIGGGIAFAAWTSTGTGTGSAGAGTDADLTVAASTVTGLYPTGTQPIEVTVTNNNDYKMVINSVTYQGTANNSVVKAVGAPAGTCTATVVSSTQDTAWDEPVAAHSSVVKTLDVTMSNAAENACKLATFTLHYDASGNSSN
jgi:hypothetical protein